MIPERAIVRMLLNSHYLYGIISIGSYTRQSLLSKLIIRTHALTILSHSNMTFIYKEWLDIRDKFLNLEFIRILRVINLSREYLSVRILHHTCGISRNTFALTAVPSHKHLIQIAVVQGIFRERHFPHAILQSGKGILLFCLPVGECAHEPYSGSIRSIFAENPSAFRQMMKTEIFISVGKV